MEKRLKCACISNPSACPPEAGTNAHTNRAYKCASACTCTESADITETRGRILPTQTFPFSLFLPGSASQQHFLLRLLPGSGDSSDRAFVAGAGGSLQKWAWARCHVWQCTPVPQRHCISGRPLHIPRLTFTFSDVTEGWQAPLCMSGFNPAVLCLYRGQTQARGSWMGIKAVEGLTSICSWISGSKTL